MHLPSLNLIANDKKKYTGLLIEGDFIYPKIKRDSELGLFEGFGKKKVIKLKHSIS